MGEWLELKTQNDLQYVFVPVTSEALKLKIKAANDSHIALTNGPFASNPITEICIGGWINSKSTICRDQTQPNKAEAFTPNILNANEHVAFWIRWHGHEVSAGLKGKPAFIKYLDPDPHPITHFAVRTGWGAVGHWEIEGNTTCEIEVSPLLFRSLPVKRIEGGQLRWVTKSWPGDQLPQDAYIGGYENGEILYVGRALEQEGVLIPGKFVPSRNCVVTGSFRVLTGYYECEILCGYNAAWLKTREGFIPPHAVPGGYHGDDTYFIGRARIDDNLIPGKVLNATQLCYIPYAETHTEVEMKEYEILVVPDKLPRGVVWRANPTHLIHRSSHDVESYDSNEED